MQVLGAFRPSGARRVAKGSDGEEDEEKASERKRKGVLKRARGQFCGRGEGVKPRLKGDCLGITSSPLHQSPKKVCGCGVCYDCVVFCF